MVTARVRREIEQSADHYKETAARYGVSEGTVHRYRRAYRKRLGLPTATRQDLTPQKVRAVFFARGTNLQISIREGVAPATVSAIKRGLYHREITGACPRIQRKVITDAMREEMGRSTEPQKIVAARLGVDVSTVKKYQQLYRALHGITVTRQRHSHRVGNLFAKAGA